MQRARRVARAWGMSTHPGQSGTPIGCAGKGRTFRLLPAMLDGNLSHATSIVRILVLAISAICAVDSMRINL